MLAGTSSDRILDALRRSAHPLDDDQLSAQAEIGSWQQVNRICRTLERYGRIRRIVGPDQRIVNQFVAPALGGGALDSPEPAAVGVVLGSPEPSVLAASLPGTVPLSSRPTPRRGLLELLGEQLGVVLAPATVKADSGTLVEIDGADAGQTVLAVCSAQRGVPTPAQEHKILADVLKVSWVAGTIQPRPRIVLCLADSAAAQPFQSLSGSWAAQALLDLGITLVVLEQR
jgi:hypothetical protein